MLVVSLKAFKDKKSGPLIHIKKKGVEFEVTKEYGEHLISKKFVEEKSAIAIPSELIDQAEK